MKIVKLTHPKTKVEYPVAFDDHAAIVVTTGQFAVGSQVDGMPSQVYPCTLVTINGVQFPAVEDFESVVTLFGL